MKGGGSLGVSVRWGDKLGRGVGRWWGEGVR